MGYEDDMTPVDNIEAANLYAEKKRLEAEKTRAETLLKHQQNQEDYENKQRKLKELSEVLGVNEMRNKIDQQDQSINYLANRMDEMIKALNNTLAQAQNIPAPMPAQQEANPLDDKLAKLQGIGAIVDQLAQAWRTIKGNESQPANVGLISQDLINEKMTKAFMDDLETGESIRQFISDALKKKATQQVVKSSLGQLGVSNEQQQHTPE